MKPIKELRFLVIGKNQEILATLKRIIENNEGWKAEILSEEDECFEQLKTQLFDLLLLSSGLEEAFEEKVKIFASELPNPVKVIEHFGGGSGLLKNEVYQAFPELFVQ